MVIVGREFSREDILHTEAQIRLVIHEILVCEDPLFWWDKRYSMSQYKYYPYTYDHLIVVGRLCALSYLRLRKVIPANSPTLWKSDSFYVVKKAAHMHISRICLLQRVGLYRPLRLSVVRAPNIGLRTDIDPFPHSFNRMGILAHLSFELCVGLELRVPFGLFGLIRKLGTGELTHYEPSLRKYIGVPIGSAPR